MQKQSNNDQNTYYRNKCFKAKNREFTIASLFWNIYNIPLIHTDNIFNKKVKLGSKGHTTEKEYKDL